MSCQAITKNQRRCLNAARPGFITCASHSKVDAAVSRSPVPRAQWNFCGAETLLGTACQNPVPPGRTTCDRHHRVALRASADESRSALAPVPSAEGSVAPALRRIATRLAQAGRLEARGVHRCYCEAVADAAFASRDPARAEFLRLCGAPE